MIKSLTIVYLTSRTDPKVEWFFDSLHRETGGDYSNTNIIVVNQSLDQRYDVAKRLHDGTIIDFVNTPPKPSIWQGSHRITNTDWWAKCNAHNTAIALCRTEWVSFCDDRSVLSHGWLQCVQDSMIHNYAVCGSYEKRANMKVRNGEIVDLGELLGQDVRTQRGFAHQTADWYGGSCALPLEWCLRVNGFPEDICDGLGFEDISFGILLRNNHFDMRYDSRMRIIEDRTPTEIGGALKRASKPSPTSDMHDAKDYRILSIMGTSKTSGNSYDLTDLRAATLRGEPFPPSSASHRDWFDDSEISEMT